ncbi:MAG: hypothetical protein V1840_02795 [Candidatus Omnitrophota bacterium]
MGNSDAGVLHPIAILKESAAGWFKNLVPLVLLYSINVFLSLMLRSTNEMTAAPASMVKPWIISAVVFLEVILMAVLSSFVCLFIINYFKKFAEEKRSAFMPAYQQTCAGFACYLKAAVMLFIFILGVLSVAMLFSEWGKSYYWAKAPNLLGANGLGTNSFRMAVLLATSTVSVALSIAAAWYGFFFLFAPLIAAFEKKGVFSAIRESRSRVRGNALRLLAPFLLFCIFYIALGVLMIFIATRFTRDRRILDFIDPAMMALFAPLALILWFVSYKKLTELKEGKINVR